MIVVNSYRYTLPSEQGRDNPIERIAVLTRDACDQYAVYVAANCSEDFCAHHGIKSNYRHALLDFPGLKESEYRA